MPRVLDRPTDLPMRAWWGAARRTVKEFIDDNMTDWAAALTYYSILSLFPAIVVLTALVGLFGASVTEPLIQNVQALTPGQSREVILQAIRDLERSSELAGPLAIIGLLAAVWAASGYIGAFIRASNAVYDIQEGRPMWKTLPLRIALTVTMVVLLATCALAVFATGAVAERLGALFGVGRAGVLIWDIAKWPVLAVLISLAFALLYWAAPNVRHPGFRWLTPGSMLAVLIWVIASVGFGIYVGNFGSYNKTYGSLAGVIVFLVWLWISNLAVLFGAEFDAELARSQRIESGQPEEQEPFLPPRDTRAMDEPPAMRSGDEDVESPH